MLTLLYYPYDQLKFLVMQARSHCFLSGFLPHFAEQALVYLSYHVSNIR